MSSEFGVRLRQLREQKRMTVQELAEASGLTRQAVGLIERGERSPSWETAVALADGLGVSVEDFQKSSTKNGNSC